MTRIDHPTSATLSLRPRPRARAAALTVVMVMAVAALLTPVLASAAVAAPARSGHFTSADQQGSPELSRSKAGVTKRNKLYRSAKLRNADCRKESGVPLGKVAQVRKYYASVLPCLNKTWSQLRKSGVTFKKPRLTTYTGSSGSACGVQGLSFYCPSERTIYMYADEIISPWKEFPTPYSRNLTRLAAVHTLAHEFGHHVQWVTRIGPALGPSFYGTQAERRLELQASCLGDAFLKSQRSAYPISKSDVADEKYWRIIQVSNHGSVRNQKYWTHRGYKTAKAGSCNTFKAAARRVR